MMIANLAENDYTSALDEELRARHDLLPRAVIDRAASAHLDDAAEWLGVRLRKMDTVPPSVVAMHKWRYGRRPVPLLPLDVRVAYRSVVRTFGERLAPAREDNDHDAFMKAPLDAGVGFIVTTDLSNYYATIAVDDLCSALLGVTGAWDQLDWLSRFLKGLAGRRVGIPQGSEASDLLGDTYAELLADNLRRRGLRTWRFADDFRIGADSEKEAIASLEIFDEECRAMGLYVNERKTFVSSRKAYLAAMNAKAVGITEVWREARDKLTVVDLYSDISIEPIEGDVDVAAAEAELMQWLEDRHVGRPTAARVELGLILTILGRAKSPVAIQMSRTILAEHPELAKQLSEYLTLLMEIDPQAVYSAVGRCLDGPVTTWHELWLLEALSQGTTIDWSQVPETVSGWMVGRAASESPIAGPAAYALARHRALTPDVWQKGYFHRNDYSSPYFIAAQADLESITDGKHTSNLDLMERFVRSWAQGA